MRYTPEIKEKAFALWCEGKSYRAIMAELGIGSINTIWHWSKPKGKKTWIERRDGIETKARQNLDVGTAEKITKMLERHYKQAANLEVGAVRALQVEVGEDAAALAQSEPDALALQRIGQTLRSAIFLERQARGLPADGLSESESLAEYTTEELKLVYEEAIRRSKETDDGS